MQTGGLIYSEGIYSKTTKKQKISHYITNWYIAAYYYKKIIMKGLKCQLFKLLTKKYWT